MASIARASNFALTVSVLVSPRCFGYARAGIARIRVPCFSRMGKRRLKLFVLRLLWIKGIQSSSYIMAAGNFSSTCCRSGDFKIEVNRAAYSAECDPACAGMPHESHYRIRQGKLIGRQPCWIMISKGRCRVILRIKSISSDTMQEVYQPLCAGERSAGIYPKRSEITPTIKRLDSSSVLQARHVLLEFIRD